MIFRDPMDRGCKREMATPDSNTMLKNFIEKVGVAYYRFTPRLGNGSECGIIT
jgi:hypothetical protein